ncbi:MULTISPECIES: YibE/F family protein [Actinotignum]|uniref:YibE/F family protein n=1 Tax=Actinotignum timonense TaxID=1870995 RepID=A0AAW9H9Q1_9ACTO|nr:MULTISPECIES: YibE/F family protein [Actinotignum]MDE1557750.1 YibE/F family protein [Actinotignum schaalii]MDE1662881.1 YibE/F family protein [Actinotignum schaalii]MDK6373667.1 YibE/F family protein [Actinotignum timonense]MDK6418253.1 YibE/F family protein [Actinotignum timonense]MDK6590665.1 YibE/F family protein [Actinotignum timonense]
MHHHSDIEVPARVRRKVGRVLAAIVVPLALLTAIALVVLWPRGESPVGSIPLNSPGVQMVSGPITSVGQTDAQGQTPVEMEVEGVPVPVHVPAEVVASGLEVGDVIEARFNPAMVTSGTAHIFVDFERGMPLALLAGLYVLVIVAVARWKGLAALAGLGVSLLVVGFFIIPALAGGGNAFAVVLTGASAMMFASIYLAHGISIRTTTAIIGTFLGLLITTAVAVWAVGAQNLSGTGGEQTAMLSWSLGGINMRTLLLAGIILAGLGALNDVTITQVSTIWELHAESPSTPRRRLISRGMAIGRDHIASTVYTLAFAYVGASLPLLILASIYQRSFLDLMQVEQIAEEITRTLAASVGLVLAIPLTTAVAALLAPVAPGRDRVSA